MIYSKACDIYTILYLIEWITKAPSIPEDKRHCLATVAPADTTHLEGEYEDFEVIGETAIMESLNGITYQAALCCCLHGFRSLVFIWPQGNKKKRGGDGLDGCTTTMQEKQEMTNF